MATAGIFCPHCQVFHPSSDLLTPSLARCPTCGTVVSPLALAAVEAGGWYCAREGRMDGPFSLTDLQLLAAVGDLHPADMVWQENGSLPGRVITARALLASEAASQVARARFAAPITGRPVAPWSVEEPSRKRPFLFVPESVLAAAAPTVPGRGRPLRAWIGLAIVTALVFGLMGVKLLLERFAPQTEKTADPGPATARNGPERGKTAKSSSPRGPILPTTAPPNTMARAGLLGGAAQAAAKPVLARVQCTTGWATFGQVLPPGAAAEGLRLGDLETQTDVKTRWPDGSIRFALVTAQIPKAGTYPLKAAPATTEFFSPKTLPYVWAYFGMGAEGKPAFTAQLDGNHEKELWLCGPLACEVRYLIEPRDAAGKQQPFLRVIFDLRIYKDGQGRADLTVENTRDHREATALTYHVALGDASGKTLWSRGNVTHPYLTRWRHVLPMGLQAAQVVPDLEPFYLARALPRYLSLVPARVDAVDGERFEGLGGGDLNPNMAEHGGRPELAPYPDWTARYLVHKDPRQLRYVLKNGDLAGSWPVHLRKANGGWPTIEERPNFWLDARATPGNRPLGDLGATGPLVPDVAHQPSLAYVPYLLTGDRYYAEEMAFWANYVLLATFQDAQYNARGGSKGFLHGHEVRGIAWAIRNLSDAAAYLPDGHPLKKHLADKLTNNLELLDGIADDTPTPLGTLWHAKRPESDTLGPRVWIALWEQNYLAWAIDRANKQGFKGGLKHRDRIAQFQLKLFTGGAAYPREFGAPYVLAVAEKDGTGKMRHYEKMTELFENNFAGTDQKGTPFAGYYGVDARLMLLLGMENGWPGAKTAHDFLWPKIAVTPHVDGQPDLALRPGWAIAP